MSVVHLLRGSRRPPFKETSEKESMALGKMGYGEPKGQSLFLPPSCKDRGRE